MYRIMDLAPLKAHGLKRVNQSKFCWQDSGNTLLLESYLNFKSLGITFSKIVVQVKVHRPKIITELFKLE